MQISLRVAVLIGLTACNAHHETSADANGDGDASGDGATSDEDVTPPASLVTTVTVHTVSELVAALAAAKPGSVVYVANDAVMNLTGKQAIKIPPQVTLASGGGDGGRGGALLYTDQLDTSPLFLAAAGSRLTGLRVRGPDPEIGPSAYYQPNSDGIHGVNASNLQVDHCEISAWSHGGIVLDNSTRVYVHHNSIHHNERNGLGYGVVLVTASSALIERNTFDYNRHAIAGTGKPNISYEARYNLVGPHRNGHGFDMHGENEVSSNGSPYAGDTIRIHDNTFEGGMEAIRIRGIPKTGAFIDQNCFAQSASAGTAIVQVFFFGHMFIGTNTYGVAAGTCHQVIAPGRVVRGDVNGDGYADLVTLANGTAHTFLGGPSAAPVIAPPVFAGTMVSALSGGTGHVLIDVADVTGDGRADLVTATTGGDVYVYPGRADGTFGAGVASFAGTYQLATATSEGFEPVAVADVDGDGHDDLVSLRGGSAFVHPGHADGTFDAHALASFAGSLNSARFDAVGHFAIDVADVTGDGLADLVTVTNEGTAYVFPGRTTGVFGTAVASFATTYHLALLDGVGFEPIGVADVDGDGRADLVSAHTNGTGYVFPGMATGAFGSSAKSFAGTMPTSLFAGDGFEVIAPLDIDGDGHADLVTVNADTLRVYRGTAANTFVSGVPSIGGFRTTRTSMHGYEPASEKSVLRRLGCAATGCF